MNGKDGKPYKTREGGVMRLSMLIEQIQKTMLDKILENKKNAENTQIDEEEAKKTANMVALAAIKYGDLSNQASKDYIFDVDRFTSFEGDTGPYILYTMVRIKSILKKYAQRGGCVDVNAILPPTGAEEQDLAMILTRFGAMARAAYEELAPHKVCSYVYELANATNRFYHSTKILEEQDETKQQGYLSLLMLTERVFETGIELLGFEAPEKM